MKERDVLCPKCSARFWTQRSLDTHLETVDHEAKPSEWTKVTIKKSIAEQGKIQAAAQNRSLANYVEYLILNSNLPKQDKEQV